jgi:hypothetical protein
VPFERLGKVRESLTVTSEQYKMHVVRYLEARGYYVKASSDVEGTFADTILTRKGDNRDYWLEAKATTVSLNDSDFLEQLAKYMSAYLSRGKENRFKMIIACLQTINLPFFKSIYEQFDSQAISEILKKMLALSDPTTRKTIEQASFEDIKSFFENTDVKEVDLQFLLSAEEKVKPTPPSKPTLSEVEYAAKVTEEFGDVVPLKSEDKMFLNIFKLEIPSRIHIAKTTYRSSTDIFAEKPDIAFPSFDLDLSGRICSFNDFTKENPLYDFISPNSVESIDLKTFVTNSDTQNIVIKILNRWIKAKCRKLGLFFDDRTKAYYYPKTDNEEGLVNAKWKAPVKESNRELTKPMKKGETTNFWVHRSAVISAKLFWDKYFIQIKPRFLFSPDGSNLYESVKADKLDRNFRKSRFSHNLNQFYDVLFWYRHVFPETENLGNANIDICLGFNPKEIIRVLDQINVVGECKPNTEVDEDIDAMEKLEADTTDLETLDPYFGE